MLLLMLTLIADDPSVKQDSLRRCSRDPRLLDFFFSSLSVTASILQNPINGGTLTIMDYSMAVSG
jgi:hypothetical protein